MSDSVRPHRWQPTRLPRPWDFPGKSTGVGCHCLLWEIFRVLYIFISTYPYAYLHMFIHKIYIIFDDTCITKYGTPLQYSCLESPMDGGAWWTAVHGVAKSHHWATSLSLFTFMHWRRKWQPAPVFLPGESQGRGSLVGCHLWGRTKSDMTEAT